MLGCRTDEHLFVHAANGTKLCLGEVGLWTQVGEVFQLAPRWCGDHCFDALMNYPFGSLGLGFFGDTELLSDGGVGGDYTVHPLDGHTFAEGIHHMHSAYAEVEGKRPTYLHMNVLDSHDTTRALDMLKGDVMAIKLCVFFQMTMPGPPMIYYGDEVGVVGGRDPDNRRAFPWDTASWNVDLHNFYRQSIALRRAHRVLRVGGYQQLELRYDGVEPLDQDKLHAFARWSTCSPSDAHSECPGDSMSDAGLDVAIVIFNAGIETINDLAVGLSDLEVAEGTVFVSVWGEETACKGVLGIGEGNMVKGIRLGPRSALVLLSQERAIDCSQESELDSEMFTSGLGI
ncbi:hypothetical protein CYMTET_26323 [Cymbomonas tetramitiformis]|uniref:Glycosyl hydrolase family 13 catalytic domain-containing protein n=1 Tax=Cymbomonas tetramitiformis TaxID=36881 RepID=A0AAE0FTJ7_9CHLO|nr:hypothetical protein CYMTET_26323 [Cymbomonas tetramitiformis]